MDAKSFWGVSAGAVLSGAVLTSCGGGLGEIVAAVAFIGSAGGDWRVDGNTAQAGLQQRVDCAAAVPPPPTAPCFINISIPGGADNFYDTSLRPLLGPFEADDDGDVAALVGLADVHLHHALGLLVDKAD
jgi:hypothetical protein